LAVIAVLAVVRKSKRRSGQTFLGVSALLAIVSSAVPVMVSAQPLMRLWLGTGLLIAVILGVAGILQGERDAKEASQRFDALFENIIKQEPAVAEPQPLNAGPTPILSWPERLYLREQVSDLIRNARNAAKALELASENDYVRVLINISGEYVNPSMAIRQSSRNVLGYPLADPLRHLPITSSPDAFRQEAVAYERLLSRIPADAPAADLSDGGF
jgi:hypothetical protein